MRRKLSKNVHDTIPMLWTYIVVAAAWWSLSRQLGLISAQISLIFDVPRPD